MLGVLLLVQFGYMALRLPKALKKRAQHAARVEAEGRAGAIFEDPSERALLRRLLASPEDSVVYWTGHFKGKMQQVAALLQPRWLVHVGPDAELASHYRGRAALQGQAPSGRLRPLVLSVEEGLLRETTR